MIILLAPMRKGKMWLALVIFPLTSVYQVIGFGVPAGLFIMHTSRIFKECIVDVTELGCRHTSVQEIHKQSFFPKRLLRLLFRVVVQLVRILALGASGRPFESDLSYNYTIDQLIKGLIVI